MANAGPVTLNRSLEGAPAYPPATPVVAGSGAPLVGAGRGPFSRPVDFTRCDVSLDSGVLPMGDFGYRLIKWFRRRIANTSGGFYGVPLAPPNWTLNKPLGGDGTKPGAPIPQSTRQWTWTIRRTYGVDRGRFPTTRHAGHDSYPRDKSGRRHQPRMRGGYGPNLLTTWQTPGSFGQQSQSASTADQAVPEFVGNGPYG